MLNLICNPKSGNGNGKRVIKKVSRYLDDAKIEYKVYLTTAPKHAISIAKGLSDKGETTIVAIGGDGTVNEVLNGINLQTTRLGIIPCGTGNDFASSVKLPLNPIKALEAIIDGDERKVDYMNCSGVRGLNVIGTGIDVDILKRCTKKRLIKGKFQYVAALIATMFKFKSYNFEIIGEDEDIKKEALIVCVCNGSQFGGGIKICPPAQVDDGLLDFIVCKGMKKRKIPSAFIRLIKGKILEQPFTEYSQIEEVKIIFTPEATLNIDGELYENLPFKVTLIKKGLTLIVPKNS